MPFIPVPNSALVELRFTANLQEVENTLWFENPTVPVPTDLDALVAAMFDWWTDNVKPLQSSGVQLREVAATSMDTATGPIAAFAPPTAEFGSNTPNIVPGNVSMSVSFRTAQRGRSFRGRNYVIGLTEDQIAGNDVVTGVTSTWQVAYFNLIAAAAAAGWTWIVASRFSGVNPTTKKPIPRAAGVTSPITSVVVVDDHIDSQRRRLTGRGK